MASQILVKGLYPTKTGGYVGKNIGTCTPTSIELKPLSQAYDQMQVQNVMQNIYVYYNTNCYTVILTETILVGA